jgi:hypothetical protein
MLQGLGERVRGWIGRGWEGFPTHSRNAADPPAASAEMPVAGSLQGPPTLELTAVEVHPAAHDLKLPVEAEQACIEIGMPEDPAWTGKPCRIYDGPLRAPDTEADAARRFAVWVQATRQAGEYSVEKIRRMYEEFCEVDHRKPVADRVFLKAMKHTRGVTYHRREENCTRGTYKISPARVVAVAKRPAGKPRKGRTIAPQRIQTAQVIEFGPLASDRIKAKAQRSTARAKKQRAKASKREAA